MASIQRLFNLALAGVTINAVLLLGATLQLDRATESMRAAEQNRFQSYLLADELRQSSDDLTRLARTYVVTGDPKWEEQYFEVLDIRNGKRPRPLGYEKIYWDFRAAGVTPPRGLGQTIALQDLMREAGFTEAEFAKLREAQANSDGLVNTETIAMNMVKGLFDNGRGEFTVRREPDFEQARRMMHDATYHAYKAQIMQPVDEFLVLLDDRTAQAAAQASAQRELWLRIAQLLALTMALLSIGLLWTLRRVVLRSLGVEPAELSQTFNTIAEGRLTEPASARRAAPGSVMAQIGVAVRRLGSAITEVKGGAIDLSRAAGELASASGTLRSQSQNQRAKAGQVSEAVESLSQGLMQAAERASAAHQSAESSRARAAEGEQVSTKVAAGIEAISGSVQASASEIQAMKQRSSEIASIVQVINDIAEKTNLLALNAAIEAARAGEQGRGFSVVADEVRKLAEQTRGSTEQISRMIGQIVHDTESAAARMEQSVDQVRDGVSLTQEMGSTMREIRQAADDVQRALTEISALLKTQSSAAAGMFAEMTQIDHASQTQEQQAEQVDQLVQRLQTLSANLRQTSEQFQTG